MYADSLRARRIDPVGLGGATLIGGAIIVSLINVAPHIVPKIPDGPFITRNIPIEKPKPIDKPKPETKQRDPLPIDRIVVPQPLTPPPPTPPVFTNVISALDPPPPLSGLGTGEGRAVEPPPAPPPALIGAEVDPRYADDFQPPYPAVELRAEMEGVITVRVQIGADGRVKAIEPVGKGSPGFFDATRRQALSRWRFKPATRGGVAIESWKTMTVRFEITS